LVKIGIIVSNKKKKHKVKGLIQYLKQKAEISLYIEDSYLLKSSPKYYFDEDLFFIKGKGELLISLAKLIKKDASIPVINPYKGIQLAINRFLNCVYLKKAGVPVPDHVLVPERFKAPFKNFIIKNIIDEKSSAFSPSIKNINGNLHVSDERAIIEAKGAEKSYHYYFYQRFINSKWEYKVYGIGDQLFFFKQVPMIRNPHKVHPKISIERIPELEEYSIKAMNTLDLRVASVDFLKSKDGNFYLTDINSGPNFNTIKNGPQILGDFLINEVRQ
jgi:glutathione synthase/RimK-type ligase-like ATP-grasp enzyme